MREGTHTEHDGPLTDIKGDAGFVTPPGLQPVANRYPIHCMAKNWINISVHLVC